MKNLKDYLEKERQTSRSKLVDICKEIKAATEKHKFKDLLFLMTEFCETDTKTHAVPDMVNFIMRSNLFFMGEDINSEKITFGADPEFILCDTEDEDKIVLFSSNYSTPYSANGEYAMSSLSIGADYGLLELRPEHSTDHEVLGKNIKELLSSFEDNNKEYKNDIKIKEAEAVPFMHKIERMRQVMDSDEEELDFGGNRSKMGGVTTASIDDISIAGSEYYGVSLTAYDTPSFAVGTEKVLTAGGHLHFGGACVKMLSMKQLKALVRKLDEKLLPIAEKVETKAADLRRKYYGFPGEFRLKPYGFEYRVLSCAPFWEKNNKTLKEVLKEANKIITEFNF
jgi:hypothetical protein